MHRTFYILTLVSIISNCLSEEGPEIEDLPIPSDCTSDFCTTKPEGYDAIQGFIDEAVKKLNLPLPMEDRSGDESIVHGGDMNNCYYTTKKIKPYTARNGKKQHLIAQSSFLQQIIEETTCRNFTELRTNLNENKECFFSDDRSEISTRCVDKIIKVDLFTYNNSSKSIEKHAFQVSVWCSCYVNYSSIN